LRIISYSSYFLKFHFGLVNYWSNLLVVKVNPLKRNANVPAAEETDGRIELGVTLNVTGNESGS
jgi:hypothetical protein